MMNVWTAFVVLARALCLRVFAAQRSVYLTDSTFDDMLLASDIAWSQSVTNPTSCARLCVQDSTCESYFHHEQQQQCYGVTTAHQAPTGSEATATGYKYYKCTCAASVCGPGYAHYLSDLGLCYHFSESKFNWLSGQAECEAMGGSLAIFRTLTEFQFIDNVMKTYGAHICSNNGVSYWVGGNYSSTAADYVWLDGVSMTTGSYSGQWASGKPKFPNRCVAVACQSTVPVDFTDKGCTVSQYVICQKSVV